MKPVTAQTPADSAIAQPAFLHKLADAKGCAQSLAALPRPWVFTNGVFDVLHRGHVVYLAQARALGGSLVVALNTDASARRLGKGDSLSRVRVHNRADGGKAEKEPAMRRGVG